MHRRLNFGRIRKDIDNLRATWDPCSTLTVSVSSPGVAVLVILVESMDALYMYVEVYIPGRSARTLITQYTTKCQTFHTLPQ
jgi:hypothetical protein